MNITMPIALTSTDVWIFVERDCECGQCIDAARIAFTGRRFVALPTDMINTDSVVPTRRDTGDVITGFVWATTADITANPHIFGKTW